MDAKLTAQAERLAREMATQASTIDALTALSRGMMKSALECMLDTEMAAHLARKAVEAPLPFEPADARDGAPKNRRNGHSKKTIQGEMGDIPLDIPRDRAGTFQPQLIGKYQRRLAGFDEKILALYAKGLTTRDIQDVVQQLDGVEVSPTSSPTSPPTWTPRSLPSRRAGWSRSGRSSTSTVSSSTSAASPAGSPSTRCTWRWASTSRAARSCWGCGWARTRGPSSGLGA